MIDYEEAQDIRQAGRGGEQRGGEEPRPKPQLLAESHPEEEQNDERKQERGAIPTESIKHRDWESVWEDAWELQRWQCRPGRSCVWRGSEEDKEKVHVWQSAVTRLVIGKIQEGEGCDGWWVYVGGNVSVNEHIVRDTRQQMERRGPERLHSDAPERGGSRGWSPVSTESLPQPY